MDVNAPSTIQVSVKGNCAHPTTNPTIVEPTSVGPLEEDTYASDHCKSLRGSFNHS